MTLNKQSFKQDHNDINEPESLPALPPHDSLLEALDRAENTLIALVAKHPLKPSDKLDTNALNVGVRPKAVRLKRAMLALARHELSSRPGCTQREAVRASRVNLQDRLMAASSSFAEGVAASVAPSRISPRRDGEVDEVAVMAILDSSPELRFLYRELTIVEGHRRRRGPRPNRGRPIATVMNIGLGMMRPSYEDAYQSFAKVPLLRHAFGEPAGPRDSSAALKQMHHVLDRHDSDYLQHVLVEQFRQVCEARTEAGELRFPQAGTRVIADGSLIQADLPQRNPRDAAEAALMRGERFRETGFIAYNSTVSAKQEPGQPGERTSGKRVVCHGWKVVTLIDQDTGAVMMADKFPANVDERFAVLELIETFFELWPDFPRFETLVADSLYDHSIHLSLELEHAWSIHPVFPQHSDYSTELPFLEGNHEMPGVLGVPCCPVHRYQDDGSPRLMTFKEQSGFISIECRQRQCIPRGQFVEKKGDKPRNIWECSVKGCNRRVTTHLADDARVFAWYHRAGNHERKALRDRLLASRNRVESAFSTLKNSGFGTPGTQRARWAGDTEMRWLFLLCVAGSNARILAQLSGAYERALAETQNLGLIESAAHPSDEACMRASAIRQEHIQLPRPPRTWSRPTLERNEWSPDARAA